MKNKNQEQQKRMPLGYFCGYKKRKDNTPKVEARPEYKNKKVIQVGRYNVLVLVVLIFTVVFVVIVLIYALYIFFHNSRLVNVANLHYSEKLKEAFYQFIKEGKIAGFKSEEGYEGWFVYHHEKMEFKYPEGWKIEEGENGYPKIRKFNRQLYNHFDSLAVSIEIKEFPNPENLEIIEFLKANNLPIVGEKLEANKEKKVLVTGIYNNARGLREKSAYWLLAGKVLIMSAVFYNPDDNEFLDEFEKIIYSVRIK